MNEFFDVTYSCILKGSHTLKVTEKSLQDYLKKETI